MWKKDGSIPTLWRIPAADLVYVAFPSSHLPSGAEVNTRSAIEDALESALEAESSGQLLGGALGIDHAYIDLLLFDGESSLMIVKDVLRQARTPRAKTRIEYFAKCRAGEGALILVPRGAWCLLPRTYLVDY
jgi:hypothetical protein